MILEFIKSHVWMQFTLYKNNLLACSTSNEYCICPYYSFLYNFKAVTYHTGILTYILYIVNERPV